MISKEKKLILLIPPKTASISIGDAFKRSGIKFSEPTKLVDYPEFHPRLSEISEIYDIKNFEDYNIFQFTRNPYYRFVSSYYQLLRISPNHEKITFSRMNFKEFVFHIDRCKSSDNFAKELFGDDTHYQENLRMKKSWSGVRMFDEQSSYNDLDSKISYFKIEDLSNSIEKVSKIISLEIKQPFTLNNNPVRIDYDMLLDSESKEVIYKNFTSDFEVLGYDK